MDQLNKDYIIYNLTEAKGEIDSILRSIKAKPGYGEADFWPAIQHLYHHVNTAWNSRFASNKETYEYSEDNFIKWRQFPGDMDMK